MTFFVLFLYHIMFDDHLKCSCEDGVKTGVTPEHCIYYMVFPAVILIFLALWMDREFQRVLRMTCRYRCDLCGRLLGIFIKAVSKGLLWVVCVLFDGDWYVCYESPESPCGHTNTPIYQEDLEKQTNIKRFSMVSTFNYAIVIDFLLWRRSGDQSNGGGGAEY